MKVLSVLTGDFSGSDTKWERFADNISKSLAVAGPNGRRPGKGGNRGRIVRLMAIKEGRLGDYRCPAATQHLCA